MDCKSCRYASWGENGVLLGCKSTCGLQKTRNAIDEMQELLDGAFMSKFVSKDACLAFRDAVCLCIQIAKNEIEGTENEERDL